MIDNDKCLSKIIKQRMYSSFFLFRSSNISPLIKIYISYLRWSEVRLVTLCKDRTVRALRLCEKQSLISSSRRVKNFSWAAISSSNPSSVSCWSWKGEFTKHKLLICIVPSVHIKDLGLSFLEPKIISTCYLVSGPSIYIYGNITHSAHTHKLF